MASGSMCFPRRNASERYRFVAHSRQGLPRGIRKAAIHPLTLEVRIARYKRRRVFEFEIHMDETSLALIGNPRRVIQSREDGCMLPRIFDNET